MTSKSLNQSQEQDIPKNCEICGSSLKYKGIGEYECITCKHIERDNYGKIRAYIDAHPGKNLTQISEATGVSRREISKMIEDERFEMASFKRY